MKLIKLLRRLCFSPATVSPAPKRTAAATNTVSTIKYPLSSTLADLFKDHQEPQESNSDALVDSPCPSPSRSLIIGTIYGHRRGRVNFCVQSSPATPPSFLFELSIPTHLLARQMSAGLLRIALECRRRDDDNRSPLHRRWTVYFNGRKMGYAVKRQPKEKDCRVLEMVRLMSAGAGVLFDDEEEGELMYMRASYERVIRSRDSVSYHLVNPGGSPEQELSIFLIRAD